MSIEIFSDEKYYTYVIKTTFLAAESKIIIITILINQSWLSEEVPIGHVEL